MSSRPPEFSSSSPSTPDRNSRQPSSLFALSNASATPAGPPPPPSSAPSFTPAGDPSPSYLQSSVAGAMTGKMMSPNFARPQIRPSKSRSTRPLASSIRNTTEPMKSSGLKQSYSVLDDLDDSDEAEAEAPAQRSGTFSVPEYDDEEDSEDADEDEAEEEGDEGVEEEEEEEGEEEEEEEQADDYEGGESDELGEEDDEMKDDECTDRWKDDGDYDDEADLLQEIVDSAEARDGGEMDLMMATPAAKARMQREADDIFRASNIRSVYGRKRDFKFPDIAKDLYNQLGYADVTEPDNVIIATEEIIHRLYDEGVGAEDDEEKLDDTLAVASQRLVHEVWEPHSKSLPKDSMEHEAKVGPGSDAPDFEKAWWIAAFALRIHHTPPFKDPFGGSRAVPLPLVMFKWQEDYHNPVGSQIDSIRQHQPCPAAHSLFWQSVYTSIVRGNVGAAADLLRRADWGKKRSGTRAQLEYTGQTLDSIKFAVDDACQLLDTCPGLRDENWDIRSSHWTLFRLKAKAAKDELVRFTEGRDRSHRPSNRFNELVLGNSQGAHHSLTGLARKAESRLPWDVYESLLSVYSILVGEAEAINAAAQDWCEATIGLFGWWDDGHNSHNLRASHSQSILGHTQGGDGWADRLALSFHSAMESDFHFNSLDPVEVCIACVFEGNFDGVIGFLRAWSLPIASSVAEIASLGRWLPPPEPQNLISMESFDSEDLELLGMNQNPGPDEQDGTKDATLVHYARALNNIRQLSTSMSKQNGPAIRFVREGWEMAVQIVGRMDSPERSEEMVGELLHGVLEQIDSQSKATVDKVWTLLNHLGLITFAEETAEKYGDILKENTHRFGDMLWYYALAHRPGKVRDVLNGLIAVSLTESTVYPPEGEMDDVLGGLLKERTKTLERLVRQDYEAAELLGTMLSGYFTLRKFYELRDGEGKSKAKSLERRRLAATALSFVIASADENIRGGLYDDDCGAVVSEDFILALLGEASVFINQSPPMINLEQIGVLLKTVEDIQTVGSRVYEAADGFFQFVLSSGQAKGSNPADLMRRSTSSMGGSYMMAESTILASQLHKSIRNSGIIKGPVKRAWDWRANVLANSTAGDLLKKMRHGLTKDLAQLWLEEADSVIL